MFLARSTSLIVFHKCLTSGEKSDLQERQKCKRSGDKGDADAGGKRTSKNTQESGQSGMS